MQILRGPLAAWMLVVVYGFMIWYLSSLPNPPIPTQGNDKLYHMVEYGILMFLLLRAMQQTFARWFSETSILLLCLFIVVCFAVTDEIHQGFVPQRISSYGDIMADATGAITMGVIWFITWKRWINQKQPAAVSEKRGELPTS